MSNKKILLKQDDCAPDSMEHFLKEFEKLFNISFKEFKSMSKYSDDIDYFKWEYLNIIVEWCIEYPFYIVYKEELEKTNNN